MKSRSRHHQPELFWPRVFMRKWLNISTQESDYSADSDDDEDDNKTDAVSDTEESCQWPRKSRVKKDIKEETQVDPNDSLPRLRRQKSVTFRAQYIQTKELRTFVGTWNVGGKVPPDDLDIGGWLDISEPADIYVIGFQEIIPLNAGNIFGSEDSSAVVKWENIIRETLSRIQPCKTKFRCYSYPPSPSRFKPSDDAPYLEDELLLEIDNDGEEEIYPINEESHDFEEVRNGPITEENVFMNAEASVSSKDADLGRSVAQELARQFSSPKRFDRFNFFQTDDCTQNAEASVSQQISKVTKTLSGPERIGLSWPEPPLDLFAQHVLHKSKSFGPTKSFKASKSFRTYSSFNAFTSQAALAELDLESVMYLKRRPQYVRIVSKQMVGIFLSIWVRRSLRRHIQNVNVATVGVGVMGYIGNKGSISVSMSIHQSLFCFICTHLTSGEKDADAVKRNSDVHDIHRRTHFNSLTNIGFPKRIHDHEKIIWLGDLNYRINLSYEKTQELISKKCWFKLVEHDQLVKELKAGRAFVGWSEGTLNFAPTYKYEINSEKYDGEDPKSRRRTPAWCDRILSYGKGMRLLNYRRTELRLSDHRPVSASYLVEVEVFSSRKLQRALTFTDAEIEDEEVVIDNRINGGMSRLRLRQDASDCEH